MIYVAIIGVTSFLCESILRNVPSIIRQWNAIFLSVTYVEGRAPFVKLFELAAIVKMLRGWRKTSLCGESRTILCRVLKVFRNFLKDSCLSHIKQTCLELSLYSHYGPSELCIWSTLNRNRATKVSKFEFQALSMLTESIFDYLSIQPARGFQVTKKNRHLVNSDCFDLNFEEIIDLEHLKFQKNWLTVHNRNNWSHKCKKSSAI